MKGVRFQLLLLAAATLGLTTGSLIFAQPAKAGCARWDVACKLREAGRQIDPTNPNSDTRRILRENDPTSPAFAENQWGNAGGAGYPAAAEWMRANNGSSQGLDETQKRYLRPHFGNLVDRVVVVYNANLMDEWSALGYRIDLGESAAQTYCERIYVDDPYNSGDFAQIELLAHELTHSKQCEQLGGAGKFGYHYFREYKRAGQNYENNKLEREAFDFEEQFAGWLSNQLANTRHFQWSQAGSIPGRVCTRIHEDADPHAWGDNYLCSDRDLGLKWSQAGPIGSMKCTRIHEDADPHAWGDNYLCVPNSSPINFRWSQAGPI